MRQSVKKEPPEPLAPVSTATLHLPSLQDFRLFALSPQQAQQVAAAAAVTPRVGWVHDLKGFLCSFCCPNGTLPEGSVHACPVPVWLCAWLGTGVAAAVPLGWSCPTEVLWGGLSQSNGDRVGLGSHRASPARAAMVAPSAAGHGVQMGSGLCALAGGAAAVPGGDPAGRRRLWGHLSACSGCLFILTSSSSPPGLVAERTQRRRRLHPLRDLLSHR